MLYVCFMCSVFPQHTLETALLSASQEIEMGSDNPAALQSVMQQRDLLQSGLLSTCRELSRVTAVSHAAHSHTLMLDFDTLFLHEDDERFFLLVNTVIHKVYFFPNQELERSWREYDKLEADVTMAKNNLLEQLEALGSPQVKSFLQLKLCNLTLSLLLLSNSCMV